MCVYTHICIYLYLYIIGFVKDGLAWRVGSRASSGALRGANNNSLSLSLSVYIYIYIYTHTYIHVYIYIYIHMLHILLYKVVKQKGALRVHYNIQYYVILYYTILYYTISFYIIACCLPRCPSRRWPPGSAAARARRPGRGCGGGAIQKPLLYCIYIYIYIIC